MSGGGSRELDVDVDAVEGSAGFDDVGLTEEDRLIDAVVDRHLHEQAEPSLDADDLARERARRIASADWAAILRELTKYAAKRDFKGCSWMDPEDYASTAIAVVCRPGYSVWDPRREPDLLRHLKSVVNGVVRNAATRAESRGPNATTRDGDGAVVHARAVGPTPERAAAMRELLEELGPRLRHRFGERGVRYFEAACAATDDDAAAIGMTIEQLYVMRKRVKGYCLKVREEIGLPMRGDFLPRYVPSPEAAALAAELDAMLPAAGRWWRRNQGCVAAVVVLAFVAVAASSVAFIVWLVLHG